MGRRQGAPAPSSRRLLLVQAVAGAGCCMGLGVRVRLAVRRCSATGARRCRRAAAAAAAEWQAGAAASERRHKLQGNDDHFFPADLYQLCNATRTPCDGSPEFELLLLLNLPAAPERLAHATRKKPQFPFTRLAGQVRTRYAAAAPPRAAAGREWCAGGTMHPLTPCPNRSKRRTTLA